MICLFKFDFDLTKILVQYPTGLVQKELRFEALTWKLAT